MGNRVHKAIWDEDLSSLKTEMKRIEMAKDIRAGYDINIIGTYKTCENVTALRCAIERNNLEIVKFILERGADPNKVSPSSAESDLYFAVRTSYRPIGGSVVFYYKDRLEIIKELIKHRANVNFHLEDRDSVLSVLGLAYKTITTGGISDESYKLLSDIIQLLVNKGADVEWEREQLRVSIEEGKSILAKPKYKSEYAEIEKVINTLSLILESLTPKTQSVKSVRPTMNNVSSVIAIAEDEDIEEVSAGAGSAPKSERILYARPYSSNRVMTARPYTPVASAAAAPRASPAPAATEVIVINNDKPVEAAVNKQLGRSGDWALYRAIENGDGAKVIQLLRAGANINKIHPRNGDTPLFFAANEGNTGIVDILIQNGVNVNIANTRTGETPLYIAALKGHLQIVRTLLSFGASPNAVVNGHRISSWARENTFSEPINTLILSYTKKSVSFSGNTKKRRYTRRNM